MKNVQELQESAGVSPVHILNSMERIGIFDTGRTCGHEYAEVVQHHNPETGNFTLVPGDRHVCGVKIFESKTSNRDLACGACSIREIDCVAAVTQVFWAKRNGKEKEIDRQQRAANARIVYSGFEKRTNGIFAQAEKMFNHQLKKYLEEKRRRDDAERQDVVTQARKRAAINSAVAALKRGEELG